MARQQTSTRTSVELFAGGGGLTQAVDAAGFRPLLLNEIVRQACDTLEANGAVSRGEDERIPEPDDSWPLFRGDVRDLKMGYLEGRVDLLTGGPPCQPFSLGGVAKGDEDKRNMFPEMFRAIRETRPKAVICENVRGLLRSSFAPYYNYITRELEFPFEERDPKTSWLEHDNLLQARHLKPTGPLDEQYEVLPIPVNAADFGIPQIRNRVLIVAIRRDLGVGLDQIARAVTPTHSRGALARSLMNGEYWERHRAPKHVRDQSSFGSQDEIGLEAGEFELRPWRTLRDALYGNDEGQSPLPLVSWDRLDRRQYEDMPLGHIGWPDARIYQGHTPNVLDRPAKTVKAGVHGVPGGESVMLTDTLLNSRKPKDGYRHRYMTVRETARVMTFPDDWKLRGSRGEQMRQLGNAVPVLLGKVFADAVKRLLDEAERRS
jgi:DNA (cytosine-5)-methyltransferase 1